MIGRLYFKGEKVVGNHNSIRRYLSYMINKKNIIKQPPLITLLALLRSIEHTMASRIER